MMRFYIPLLALALALGSQVLVGCGKGPSFSYHHPQFGYTVEMPEVWVVDEDPWFSGRKGRENTVQFRAPLPPKLSWDEALNVDWVNVQVTGGKTALEAVLDIRVGPNSEVKVSEYGKNGYYEESRYVDAPLGGPVQPKWTDWQATYYIEYNGRLYTVTFRNTGLRKKVFVSIDGYGKVNY